MKFSELPIELQVIAAQTLAKYIEEQSGSDLYLKENEGPLCQAAANIRKAFEALASTTENTSQ